LHLFNPAVSILLFSIFKTSVGVISLNLSYY
jgi:hypothetical protein